MKLFHTSHFTLHTSLLLFSILIIPFFHCRIFNPAEPDPVTYYKLHSIPDADTDSGETLYINKEICFQIDAMRFDNVDSVVCDNSVSNDRFVFPKDSIAEYDTVCFSIDHPCSLSVFVNAYIKDSIVAYDDITVYVTPKNNYAPEITINPVRNYASVSLPCTVSVAVHDSDSWDTYTLTINGIDTSRITYKDSLVIFTLDADENDSLIKLGIGATDDGKPPKSDTEWISIVVVEDDVRFPPPLNVKVVERSEDRLRLTWDRNSLADEYTVYRSHTADGDTWDSIATLVDTNFTDETDTNYFYRLVTGNYFGNSDSGAVVFASDTLHYSHIISFVDNKSTVSENDSVHAVTLQVSKEALKPISVWVSITESDRVTCGDAEVVVGMGETSVEIPLMIHDNNEDDDPETVKVVIDSVSSGYVLGIRDHLIEVMDDDTFYTVTYDRNGADSGEVPYDTTKYKPDEEVIVLGDTGELKRIGYSFKWWNIAVDGSGSAYEAGTKLKIYNEDIILYAQWTLKWYTITYHKIGEESGTVPEDTGCYFGSEYTIAGNSGNLTREGYFFAGWSTEPDGNETTYNPDTVVIMGADKLDLYAKWIPISSGMVKIEAKGKTFLMGDDYHNRGKPIHQVIFTEDFWLDTTEVTQRQYRTLMTATYGDEYMSPVWNSTYGLGDDYPVYYVNWFDAVLYCNARTRATGSSDTVYRYTKITGTPGNDCELSGLSIDLSKRGFRLPTEAQWEYACCGGTRAIYYWTKQNYSPYPATVDDSTEVDSHAVWRRNSFFKKIGDPDYGTHPVARKLKNPFGLYDMSGNLWEWCNDVYKDGYDSTEQIDPQGPLTGMDRVLRGGSWDNDAIYLRSVNRYWSSPGVASFYTFGFRVLLPSQ